MDWLDMGTQTQHLQNARKYCQGTPVSMYSISLRNSSKSRVVIAPDLLTSAAIILYGESNWFIPKMCCAIKIKSYELTPFNGNWLWKGSIWQFLLQWYVVQSYSYHRQQLQTSQRSCYHRSMLLPHLVRLRPFQCAPYRQLLRHLQELRRSCTGSLRYYHSYHLPPRLLPFLPHCPGSPGQRMGWLGIVVKVTKLSQASVAESPSSTLSIHSLNQKLTLEPQIASLQIPSIYVEVISGAVLS